jgi:hypothetical protein
VNYGDIISIIALLLSFLNLYLYYSYSKKSVRPTINHVFENLPPYRDDKEETIIKVRNVGTASAKVNAIYLNFSWDKDLQMYLYDEKSGKKGFLKTTELYLTPNDEEIFRKRLPQPPQRNRETIKITTKFDDGWSKEDEVRIENPKGNISFFKTKNRKAK